MYVVHPFLSFLIWLLTWTTPNSILESIISKINELINDYLMEESLILMPEFEMINT